MNKEEPYLIASRYYKKKNKNYLREEQMVYKLDEGLATFSLDDVINIINQVRKEK